MLELRHLRMLYEVARAGSFSGAARELGYTQPAISQQMRALERAFGTPLVVREGRRVVFTEAGAELLRHAEDLLHRVTVAQTTVAAVAGRHTGRVRLTVFPSGSATLVPPVAALVRSRHPAVSLSLAEGEPPDSLHTMRSGGCDVVLGFSYPEGRDEPEASGLLRMPLMSDPLVALLPAGHHLAQRRVVHLAELAGEAWIGGCPRCRGHLVDACATAGFTPDITFATDDTLAVQGLVAAGLGVSVTPRLMLAAACRPDVVARPLEPAMHRSISAFTWPDLVRVPTVRIVLDAFRDVTSAPIPTAQVC
ncbi:LysR family transcriptional regulator [Amycolatopsis cihanbeyliensis]|uniref:DNA-binding transcriptional LysR family regulator n=1 Tax=Amycolatopsis cihanbeyliensis TaxID=1128664 RepID=A0A542CSY2_AMYCI|nr:LysR family transcriptional regulator [Amycolatopsis cihanbeyliensis]TQI93929.1 DNA-binding transcriptional LysR family regulator [Amycolatopsis cihanbeyliensis]